MNIFTRLFRRRKTTRPQTKGLEQQCAPLKVTREMVEDYNREWQRDIISEFEEIIRR